MPLQIYFLTMIISKSKSIFGIALGDRAFKSKDFFRNKKKKKKKKKKKNKFLSIFFFFKIECDNFLVKEVIEKLLDFFLSNIPAFYSANCLLRQSQTGSK
jgi:hypothetical protein